MSCLRSQSGKTKTLFSNTWFWPPNASKLYQFEQVIKGKYKGYY